MARRARLRAGTVQCGANYCTRALWRGVFPRLAVVARAVRRDHALRSLDRSLLRDAIWLHFHTVPQKGEFGYDTWLEGSAEKQTNTGVWAHDAYYAKTLAGWCQALTVGHPEFPPTLWFFRNTMLGDLLFTGLFAFAVKPVSSRNTIAPVCASQ